jgi:hypothetical protein
MREETDRSFITYANTNPASKLRLRKSGAGGSKNSRGNIVLKGFYSRYLNGTAK